MNTVVSPFFPATRILSPTRVNEDRDLDLRLWRHMPIASSLQTSHACPIYRMCVYICTRTCKTNGTHIYMHLKCLRPCCPWFAANPAPRRASSAQEMEQWILRHDPSGRPHWWVHHLVFNKPPPFPRLQKPGDCVSAGTVRLQIGLLREYVCVRLRIGYIWSQARQTYCILNHNQGRPGQFVCDTSHQKCSEWKTNHKALWSQDDYVKFVFNFFQCFPLLITWFQTRSSCASGRTGGGGL